MDWRDRAACLEQNPELFFPVGLTGTALLQLEQAKRVCGDCAVREECLRWALELGLDHGVWGGASEEERRSIKRRAARARALNRAKASKLQAEQHAAQLDQSARSQGAFDQASSSQRSSHQPNSHQPNSHQPNSHQRSFEQRSFEQRSVGRQQEPDGGTAA